VAPRHFVEFDDRLRRMGLKRHFELLRDARQSLSYSVVDGAVRYVCGAGQQVVADGRVTTLHFERASR